MRPRLSTPSVVNLELTDLCNEKCRHCYNFWREENSRTTSITKERFDELVALFKDAGIFHVVLTGGEPMLQFDLLEYGLTKLGKAGISVSCNSNLMFLNNERAIRLRETGLDHILTSLCSHDPETNDYMTHSKGSHGKILNGIQTAIKNGIRVSVNMVVSQRNKDHVYATGKLVHELGCQKIFGTRTVPSVNLTQANGTEFELSREDALHTLDQLVRLKEETGIMIGTLVSYPLCLLGDLDRYRDFVGRGCPAQSGHVMSLNANGDAHACAHESQDYGNVFRDGIRKVFAAMQPWHDGSYTHSECQKCDYLDICQSGCRMSARGYEGKLNGADQLMVGPNKVFKAYQIVQRPEIYHALDSGQKFTVPERIRFRKESYFYLINIRWANSITCDNTTAEFLIQHQKSRKPFDLAEFGEERRELLAQLWMKDAVETTALAPNLIQQRSGLGADIVSIRV